MNTYDNSQAAQFGALLAKREAELRALLRAANHLSAEDGASAAHEVEDFKDAADEEALALVDDMQSEHAAQELQQVVAARQRLERQEYGLCVACGEAIDLRRLLALPAAPLCAACQTRREGGGKSATRA